MSQRKNYHTVRYGTRDGELQFGHIHKDNNESAVMLRSGHDFIHYISMDSTGNEVRKHGTICRSPGSFQVKAGDNAKVTDDNKSNEDSELTVDTSYEEDIDIAIKSIKSLKKNNNIILLHCTSIYPTKKESTERKIPKKEKSFIGMVEKPSRILEASLNKVRRV